MLKSKNIKFNTICKSVCKLNIYPLLQGRIDGLRQGRIYFRRDLSTSCEGLIKGHGQGMKSRRFPEGPQTGAQGWRFLLT